jgi:ABC-type transporter Mla subunit MlaD
MMQKIDGNVVQKLPPLLDKLDTTLARLDSAAGNADAILGENRAAISSFSNDGLAQLGPTLSELRGLTRDLRQVSDRLQATLPATCSVAMRPRSSTRNERPPPLVHAACLPHRWPAARWRRPACSPPAPARCWAVPSATR